MTQPPDRRVEEDRAREDAFDLLEGAAIVWRRRSLVLTLAFALGTITLVYSLLQPNVYEAAATIVAPGDESAVPGRDLLIAVLKSRTMAEDVVERFHLKERFNAARPADAVQTLQSQTDVSLTKEGVIVVKVETTDPQLSADVANYHVSALHGMVERFGATAAARQRAFVEARLRSTEEDLSHAEEALLRFEELNRAVALREQAGGTAEGATPVKSAFIAVQSEMEALRSWAIESSLAPVPVDSRGTATPFVPDRNEVCDDTGALAGLGLNLARLTRDVKVQEAVYTLLRQQLEQAKIAEAREAPRIQTLDRAVPAGRKRGPRVAVNVLLAAVAGGAVAVFLALLLESSRRRAEVRAHRAKAVIDLELDADGVHARPPERIPRDAQSHVEEVPVQPIGRPGKKARRPVERG
jgi:uncharacterized protein involved in exopolysaccharide biosynthesis